MFPQFFDLIGVRAQGVAFEAGFWTLIALLGVIVCLRELRSGRTLRQAFTVWGIGVGLFGYALLCLARLALSGELYFGERGLQVSNYSVSLVIAFTLGITLAFVKARRAGVSPTGRQVLDVSFWMLLGSLVGARLVFIVTRWREYVDLCFAPERVPEAHGIRNCLAILEPWRGGLVFYGGFLGAVIAALVYCRRHRLSFLRLGDVMIPSVALGHFIGRLGCLSAGCCFGRPTAGPLGIVMPAPSPAFASQLAQAQLESPLAVSALLTRGCSWPIHPTQLYEATAELLLFGLLLFRRSRKRFEGELLATWLLSYGLARVFIELFRGDKIRGLVFEWPVPRLSRWLGLPTDEPIFLSTSQTLSLVIVGAGLCVWALGVKAQRGATTDGRSSTSGGSSRGSTSVGGRSSSGSSSG